MPKENEHDLEEVPDHVRKKLKFIFVEHLDEVLEVALRQKQPQPKRRERRAVPEEVAAEAKGA